MDADLALVLGIVLGALSIPSVLSAISDRRAPSASIVTILIGGGLIYYASQNLPGGIVMQDIPDKFVNVVARYMP